MPEVYCGVVGKQWCERYFAVVREVYCGVVGKQWCERYFAVMGEVSLQ